LTIELEGRLVKLIDLSAVSDVDKHADAFLDDLCQRLEFDYASYAMANPVSGDVQGYANYPDEWKRRYGELGLHRIDPTLHLVARSIAPVDWGRMPHDDKFQRVFRPANDFGITDRGITVPVRGPYGECGLLSVTRKCGDAEWERLKAQVMGDLQVSAVHIHDNVMRSGVLSTALYTRSLSSREREILQWSAIGKSQQDIADILSISHRTVEVHLRAAREKLGALTTAQAVGRAIGLGVIVPG